MDREILSIYLQSGPARKLDVCRFTAEIASSGGSNESYLFQNKFLNNSILFKCVILGDYAGLPHEMPIPTLIYMPYDTRRPDKGGESFVFSTKSFSRYCAHKVHAKNIGLTAMERDLEVLRTLDSLPTFSPLIAELAFERNNMTIPSAYVDLTPELRNKLRAQLKGRIRPLIVAAYDRSSISVEKAVEEMTNKLFYLKNIRQILPLVQALHLAQKCCRVSVVMDRGYLLRVRVLDASSTPEGIRRVAGQATLYKRVHIGTKDKLYVFLDRYHKEQVTHRLEANISTFQRVPRGLS